MTSKIQTREGTEPVKDDAFQAAWKQYDQRGLAGGWEKVAFTSGFGHGWKACEAEHAPASHGTTAMDHLLAVIRTWIETESGPTFMTFSHPELKLQVKLRGYKKIILERKFDDVPSAPEGKKHS